MTKAAALEGAANGVRVTAVAPGPVETEMLNRFTGGGEGKANFLQSVPVKRAASPQEIADTILFLACKAPFLTGQSIVVVGARPPLSGQAFSAVSKVAHQVTESRNNFRSAGYLKRLFAAVRTPVRG